MIRLYQIPKQSKIILDNEEVVFHHTDGMYSYCESPRGVVHLSVMTPLVQVGDHYEIDDTYVH